ncbi:UMP kinase [Candidatus Woesearchaeota archaeon]|nr:UMP kinase [Candidatus Woesearchaeota archaeon]
METIVLSLGGSLIVPDRVDFDYLKKFKHVIERFISRGFRFVIVCGGGKTARDYQRAANSVGNLHPEDLDWLGIHATRINAHLLRTIFRDDAHPKIITDPTDKIDFKENILLAAGWKPGFSTDMDAVLLAENIGVKRLINLSNIDYVYDKDPKDFKNAKRFEELHWRDFRNIVGNKWNPGLNVPFDPVASKEAEKIGLTVIITNGKDLDNFERILDSKRFKGTTIH